MITFFLCIYDVIINLCVLYSDKDDSPKKDTEKQKETTSRSSDEPVTKVMLFKRMFIFRVWEGENSTKYGNVLVFADIC